MLDVVDVVGAFFILRVLVAMFAGLGSLDGDAARVTRVQTTATYDCVTPRLWLGLIGFGSLFPLV